MVPETSVNPLHPSVADKLDPDFARIYNTYQASNLRADQVPYEIYNKDRPKYTFPTCKVEGTRPNVKSVTTHKISVTEPAGEVSVQVLVPTDEAISAGGLRSEDGRLPAYIDYHGGGFVIGDLNTDLTFCHRVCHSAGCIVVNVDYRLSPEFPHPTPAMDSYGALKWVAKNADALGIDSSRMAVGGFSAGGCLAAAACLMARDDPDPGELPKLRLQILIVPVLDARYVPEEGSCSDEAGTVPYESYKSLEFAPMLPLSRLVWFYKLWLGIGPERAGKASDFRASPMAAKSFENLAPASVHCAGIDPLVSEGKAYHEKLLAAGTPSKLKVYKGVGHTFGHWVGELPAGREFMEDVLTALMDAFRTG